MSPANPRKRELEADEGVTRRITRSMTRTPEAVPSSDTAPTLANSTHRELSMSPESSPDRASLPEPDIQSDTAGSNNGPDAFSLRDTIMVVDDWTDPWETREQNWRWNYDHFWGGTSETHIIDISWQQLIKAVCVMTGLLANHGDTYEVLDSSSREVVESIWPHAKEIVDHPDGHGEGLHHMLQAYVWRLLWEQQLSPACADKWPTEEWSAFQKLGSHLQPHVNHGNNSLSRCYYQWRSSTARMLFALNDPRPAIRDRIEKLLSSDPLIAYCVRVKNDAQQALVNSGAKLDPFVRDFKTVIEESFKEIGKCVADFDFVSNALKFRCELSVNDEETGKLFDFPFRTTGEMRDTSLGPVHEDDLPVDMIVQPRFKAYGIRDNITAATSRTHLSECDVEDRDQWFMCSALEVRVRGKADAATNIKNEVKASGTGRGNDSELVPIPPSLIPPIPPSLIPPETDRIPRIVRRYLKKPRP